MEILHKEFDPEKRMPFYSDIFFKTLCVDKKISYTYYEYQKQKTKSLLCNIFFNININCPKYNTDCTAKNYKKINILYLLDGKLIIVNKIFV
jgi:hypothetical protein